MIPILSGNVASALGGAYEVANSCRFNDDDGPILNKSSGTPSSRRIFTFSCWAKRGNLNSGGSDPNKQLFSIWTDTSNRMDLRFQTGDTIDFYHTSSLGRLTTNRLFRDPSSWYHVCLRVDTTQASSGNRYRLYVNGTQETSFSTETQPSQDADLGTNFDNITVGDDAYGTSHFDGYLAEVCYCDGQSYAPTEFGEFDEDSPTIWKPKDVSGLTFGTNGFYLDFEDSANLGNDANGGTDFTESGLAATDQATDTPTNNFATLNPLEHSPNSIDFSEGNCVASGSSGDGGRFTAGTFAPASGKWWCEIKVTVGGSYPIIGIIDSTSNLKSQSVYFVNSDSGSNQSGFAVFSNDDVYHNNDSTWDQWQTYATNDIIGIGLDMDASTPTITFQKNGGSEETFTTEVPNSGNYNFPALGLYSASAIAKVNFGGCPPYTISSSVADGNGYGSFEYAPKTGYLSMCSKNIGENS